MSSYVMALALVLTVAGSQAAAAQSGGAMRFQGLDRNGDGRITRAEWNGSDQSFRVHDWNGDGVLSGDEVRAGARVPRQTTEPEIDSRDREYAFDDWTVRGFNSVDRNNDSVIVPDEWHFDRASFRRADHNDDGVITRSEFLNEDGGQNDTDPFAYLDANGDNRISRDEWRGTRATFDGLDDNRDGRLNRAEFSGVDQDGPRSQAFQAGYNRGLIEGRAAGREDRERNQGWDLEGQRELEQADSGYTPALGSRTDYQAGYRAAFRLAYREGFGPR